MSHEVFFNFQGNAVAAVLAFLLFGGLEGLAGLAAVLLFAVGKRRAAAGAVAGAAGLAALYGWVLLTFSLASREQVAAPGDEKYFCEVDCHLAYSVVDVRQAKVLGAGASRATARGLFRVVTLRVRFDPETTFSRRPKEMALTPNPRSVWVVTACGATYRPDAPGQRALEAEEGPAMPLTTPLLPGESYTTRLVFDVPESARSPRLLLTESDWITRVLIGHENSPLHRKTAFRL